MIEAATPVAAAVLAGLLGSAHCLGMCGGISGLFAVNSNVASLRAQLPRALVYNFGRLLSYAVLGALVGLFGGSLLAIWPELATPVRLIGGVLIILVGLRIAFNWRLLEGLEKAGARLWGKIAPLARSVVPVTSAPRALALGLLWGWLPCGLVYSVLLIAATGGSAQNGATIMLAFGIGTLPSMLLSGLGAARFAGVMRRRSARLGMGLLVVVMGVVTLAVPVQSWLGESPHAHHHHHG